MKLTRDAINALRTGKTTPKPCPDCRTTAIVSSSTSIVVAWLNRARA